MYLGASPIDFNLYKMESHSHTQPTLLLIAGIQGDEPGGFNATSIFIKHYKILSGSVWVIPNLNQHSILKNNRGIYGDMNRKFAHLNKSDPEYAIIQHIKQIILSENVDRILHLHDGSGFYREKYINNLLNQNRWGNCSIIDQNTLFELDDLNNNITKIVTHINDNLLNELHKYHVKNTHTSQGDNEQNKSLTYFAIQNNKMAFANEASKSLPLSQRVYYHLLAIEGMLNNMNIKFERDFRLDTMTINELINDKNMNIIVNDIIEIPLYNLKPEINFFPTPKDGFTFHSNTPIIWLFEDGKKLKIKNGNRHIVSLNPFFTEFDYSLENVSLVIDGNEIQVPIGTMIQAKESVLVSPLPYRVNIIGYYKEGISDESNITITKNQLMKNFSIDKNNQKFRIEFYKQETNKEDKFAGMIIIDFSQSK